VIPLELQSFVLPPEVMYADFVPAAATQSPKIQLFGELEPNCCQELVVSKPSENRVV
jgi:hypothetical protein